MTWPLVVAALVAWSLIGAGTAVAAWPRVWRFLPRHRRGRPDPLSWTASLVLAGIGGAAWPVTLPYLARRTA